MRVNSLVLEDSVNERSLRHCVGFVCLLLINKKLLELYFVAILDLIRGGGLTVRHKSIMFIFKWSYNLS